MKPQAAVLSSGILSMLLKADNIFSVLLTKLQLFIEVSGQG